MTKIRDALMGSGTLAHVSHFGALKTSGTHPVLKGNFAGVALDATVWTETLVGAATNPVGDGVARPTTTTAVGDSVKITSVETGIFEAGQVTVYQSGVFPGVGVLGNTRRWGLMDASETNGLFFEWVGTTFQVTARKGGVDTSVTSDSFSVLPGYTPGNANNTFRIFYSAGRAIFCRSIAGNSTAIHTMVDGQFPLVNDLDLGIYYENTNTATTAVGVEMRIRGASSSVFGNLPTSRANATVTDGSVAALTKSILTGRDGTGAYRNVITNTGGGLVVAPFIQEVAEGLVPGFSTFSSTGQSIVLPPAGPFPQDVWNSAGVYTGQPTTAAETIQVFSSAGADTNAAGTGARTVRITGLDENFDPATEDFALAGVTPVTSVSLWSRVFSLVVLTAGSGAANAGNITVRQTPTTTNVFVFTPIGRNASSAAVYTVPADTSATLQGLEFIVSRTNGSNGSATVNLLVRPPGSVYRSTRRYNFQSNGGLYKAGLDVPVKLAALTDVKVQILAVSDTLTVVTASLQILERSTS